MKIYGYGGVKIKEDKLICTCNDQGETRRQKWVRKRGRDDVVRNKM